MVNKIIKIDDETDELLANCREEFLRHHPEMKKIRISYNKIIYETAKLYMRV